CWIVQDLLSRNECSRIVQIGLANDIEHSPGRGDVRHRNNSKIALEDSELASTLWERIKDVVPQEYTISSNSKDTAPDMLGTWRISGVNSTFTLLFYRNGGHFGPHRDGYVIKSEHERSILTLAVYLNDRPENHGGGTNFLLDDMDCPAVDNKNRIRSPEEFIELQVASDKAGKACCFLHELMHEGETLEVKNEDGSIDEEAEATPKWLLITQIMYTRDPSTAPQLTVEQKEAREVLKEAEQAEIDGGISLAIKKYNKAYRLDPSLDT
ncbi:MAG: hypothetical protein SGILL_007885, partial [Bacillariaceae sp.]